jgi:hypothetical protein
MASPILEHSVFFPVSQEDLDRALLLLDDPSNEIKNDNDNGINCIFILQQNPAFTNHRNLNIFKIMNSEPTTHQQIIEILNLTSGFNYGYNFKSGDKNFLSTSFHDISPGHVMLCSKAGKYFLLYHNINPRDYRLIYRNNMTSIDCFFSDASCPILSDPQGAVYSVLYHTIPNP